MPYEAPSRAAIVAISLREWNAFGQRVEDPAAPAQPLTGEEKPERQQGLWQRVGEYWWLGMNLGSPESGWTGKHDGSGRVFPPSVDGEYAWSAAFVSYVMRMSGFASRFPYSPNHATYIDIAKQMALHETRGWLITAERPETYAPLPGDMICMGRGAAHDLTYDELPAGLFPAHCDIVVSTAEPGYIGAVGGNVDDAVTLKRVPVTVDGKVATPEGLVLDPDHHWMVVVRVLLDSVVS